MTRCKSLAEQSARSATRATKTFEYTAFARSFSPKYHPLPPESRRIRLCVPPPEPSSLLATPSSLLRRRTWRRFLARAVGYSGHCVPASACYHLQASPIGSGHKRFCAARDDLIANDHEAVFRAGILLGIGGGAIVAVIPVPITYLLDSQDL